ncbi:GntR family transcriptional regulator [Streptomyces tendae]|uniref:GntR family transcriptional regulator n=1 Tax=Streptomyces tendae TaxID=1932 RepID=UPI0024907407|nr:GntR family transcriptional regulator [Streptomyces tendae]
MITTKPQQPERTALYRYYDATDTLLYIGISNDPDFRAKAHLYESRPGSWPKQATHRIDEWHDSRALALAAEEEAIRTERPRYNGKHNYDDASFTPEAWPAISKTPKVDTMAALMRDEITSGRWRASQRIPSLRTLGAAAGVSQRIVSKASVILQGEGLLDLKAGHGLFVRSPSKTLPSLPHDWPQTHGFPG